MTRGTEKFRAAIAADRLVLCMATNHARTPDFPYMVEAAGFDAFYVDTEHYPYSVETASMLCTVALATEVTSFVRVPNHDAKHISCMLDGGASGIIVPHVKSAVEARAIVEAARFPPLGRRGMAGPNSVTAFRAYGAGQSVARLDDNVLLVPMLESVEAIEAADDIAAVEGIDVLLVGSGDLTLELGIPGQVDHHDVIDAFSRVGAACRRHGKILGVAGVRDDPVLMEKLVGFGARFLIAGSDTGYMIAAARNSSAQLRRFERKDVATQAS